MATITVQRPIPTTLPTAVTTEAPRFRRLLNVLALVYPALVLYGSLFPFSGWRAFGVPVLEFLDDPFPRYWTSFDLASNLALYVPLGYVWTRWALGRRWLAPAWLLAPLAATALSLGVEILQHWLPSRVPSNLDLACNAAGALLGAVAARSIGHWLGHRLGDWLDSWFDTRQRGSGVLIALSLWLLTHLNPTGPVLSAGDWRELFANTLSMPVVWWQESIVVACFLVGVGLLLTDRLRVQSRARLAQVLLFILCALTLRALAGSVLAGSSHAFDWLTRGAEIGLAAGAAGLLLTSWWAPRARLWVAGLAIAMGTVWVNLLPLSPYELSPSAAIAVSPFRNFVGLFEWLNRIWPALCIIATARRLRCIKNKK